ncbi:Serine/threonine-protein kinase/endoribonuclease ire-1 [Morus notabilis]|uniref:non-specific serine/threonine protein kinase n=1 Tax=Morus notabilis TaxID=981085 RepID=W9QQP3_9ROSA|nr:Serine/threonine-protein kinase/endoribonuclease ire-1 [Morus notabilis]
MSNRSFYGRKVETGVFVCESNHHSSMRGGDLAGNLLRTLLRRELQQLWVDEKTGKAIRRLKAYGSCASPLQLPPSYLSTAVPRKPHLLQKAIRYIIQREFSDDFSEIPLPCDICHSQLFELLRTVLFGLEAGVDDNTPEQIIELLKTFDIIEYAETVMKILERTASGSEKKIGKIKVLLSKEIGRSANGTIVYEGYYEERQVAVKCLTKNTFKRDLKAQRETKTLIASDRSQNIVTYYGKEADDDNIYLALERCDCNLDNLIQMYPKNSSRHKRPLSKGLKELKKTIGDIKLWKENTCRPFPILRDLMRGMVSGLNVLHKSGIVHRHLKPQNIFIIHESGTLCAKLGDMGISRRLRAYRNHGWKAPEELLDGQQTTAMDLFTLGCILFFSITGGKHPFGEQDRNIKSKDYKPDLHLIEKFPEAVDLISSLIKFEAGERPQANKVLHHPLFWDAKKRLEFLCATSNSVTKESTSLSDNKKTTLLSRLESTAIKILGKFSPGKVKYWSEQILNDKIKQDYPYILWGYKFGSVQHLLRFIRNRRAHYEDDPKEIQDHFGTKNEGFDDYFTSRFPLLFFEVYNVVRDCCREDALFKAFF